MLEDSSVSDWDDDFALASGSPNSSLESHTLAFRLKSAVGIVADEDDIEDWDADFESQEQTTAESTSASISKQGMYPIHTEPSYNTEEDMTVAHTFSVPALLPSSIGTRKLNQLKREMTISSKRDTTRRPTLCNLWTRQEMEGTIPDALLLERLRSVHLGLLGRCRTFFAWHYSSLQ